MQPDVVVIGSGRLAGALLHKLCNRLERVSLIARNADKALDLQQQYKSIVLIDYNLILPGSLCLLAVSDSGIADCAAQIKAEGCSLIHFSGTSSLLQGRPSGVFWPVHSFGNGRENWEEIPVITEVSSDEIYSALLFLKNLLGCKTYPLNELQRKKMHMMAVVVNNFSNHLFALANKYCSKNELDFSLLHHLIVNGARSLLESDPQYLQTGPAIRKDFQTIANHLELLKDDKEFAEVYRLLTDSIISLNKSAG